MVLFTHPDLHVTAAAMTLRRLLLNSFRRYSCHPLFRISATAYPPPYHYYSAPYNPCNPPYPNSNQLHSSDDKSQSHFSSNAAANHSRFHISTTPGVSPPQRLSGFSAAEEDKADRRRRKRRFRIEPPCAPRSSHESTTSNANNTDKPKLPESFSALVGPRLNLHNRVQSLIRAGDLDAASYVARQYGVRHVPRTVFTCNAIIAAMCRAKRYNDAKALFQYFFRQMEIIPNISSYNNLIVSHCELNEVEEAMNVYGYILENAPFSPSAVTYRHLTKGLIDAGRINDAVSLLREMLLKGHGTDSLVFNNLILGFLNLGNLEKANELFDELKGRCTVYDGVVNATFMDWFFNQGQPKEAMESYRDLMSRNYRMVPATRNVLLQTLLRHGKKKEAWDLFQDMLDDHTPPTFQAVNSDTFNMMVNECFKEGKVQEAMQVFARSGKGDKSRPFQMDVAGFNNMMLRLCELELMDEAEQYYKQLCNQSSSPDVNTYRTLIDAYIKLDRVDSVLEKYAKMVEAGLRVIPPYANKWFGYLIEKGRASDCVHILSKMAHTEPKPDVSTFDIVIRGLVEEDNFGATASLIRKMMNQCIGTTPSLKRFVLDVFERQGLRQEIENILNRLPSSLTPQRPNRGARGPPGIARPPEMEQMEYPYPMLPTFEAVNSETINMMVNKCFKEGKVQEAMEVFTRSGKGVKSKPFQMDVACFNNMILRLCELEMMGEAERYYKQLCDESLSPDVNTYRMLIDAYIKADMVENVVEKYTKMVEAGLKVIPPYANKWFGYLVEKGRASDCFPILSKMANIEPKPDVTTYDIVIRGLLLVEEDNFDAVASLIRGMINQGTEPTSSLKEFVLGFFEGQGLRREMQNILNRCPGFLNPQGPYRGTGGLTGIARPPEMVEQGGTKLAMHWQDSFFPTEM